MSYSHLVPLSIQNILDKALLDIALNRGELISLLSLDANSTQADALRLVGRHITKERFGMKSMLLCQTGVESFPCPADCVFCSFRQSAYTEPAWRIEDEHLTKINSIISHAQGIYAHFLLFMHTFDFSHMLRVIEKTRAQLPAGTSVVVNCGDVDAVQAKELKAAGADGAYHVVRLREGQDTQLNPTHRINTIKLLKDANLDWYTCCEPIGAEHSNEEIIDNILLSTEYNCFQNAVMRRITVPDSILESKGQISLLRSAQIVAVVAIAMRHNTQLSSIAIHEPDLLGLTSGANCIYAEFGSNPRDMTAETSHGRGHSPEYCRAILRDVGFNSLMQAKGCNDISL